VRRQTRNTVAHAVLSILRRGAGSSGRSDVGDFVLLNSGIDGRVSPVRGDQIPEELVKVESWRIFSVTLFDYTDVKAGDRIGYGPSQMDVRYVFGPTTGIKVQTVCFCVMGG